MNGNSGFNRIISDVISDESLKQEELNVKKVWIGLLALVLAVGLGVPAAMAVGTEDVGGIRRELPVPAAEPQYGQAEVCEETCVETCAEVCEATCEEACDEFCGEACEETCEPECSREHRGDHSCRDGETSHCPSESCQSRNGHHSGGCGRQEGHCGGHHGHHGGHR